MNVVNIRPVSKADDAYITVLQYVGSAGKVFSINANGAVEKRTTPSEQLQSQDVVGITTRCGSATELAKTLSGLTDKRAIIAGYWPGVPLDTRFIVLTKDKMQSLLKQHGIDPALAHVPHELEFNGAKQWVVARLKEGMKLSGWAMFDIDDKDDMPAALRDMTVEQRVAAMEELLPGLKDAAKVLVGSASAQLLVDGQPYKNAQSAHVYVRVNGDHDSRDAAYKRFTKAMVAHPVLGFLTARYSAKTGQIVARVPWGVADPSVFSPERLVFEAPAKKGSDPGNRLSLVPRKVEAFDGGVLDLSRVPEVSADAKAVFETSSGYSMDAEGTLTNTSDLTLDTLFETENGPKTFREYSAWAANKKGAARKLRCQTVFRDSNSWNGILNCTEDGTPFHFDNGLRAKYFLRSGDAAKARFEKAGEGEGLAEMEVAVAAEKASAPARKRGSVGYDGFDVGKMLAALEHETLERCKPEDLIVNAAGVYAYVEIESDVQITTGDTRAKYRIVRHSDVSLRMVLEKCVEMTVTKKNKKGELETEVVPIPRAVVEQMLKNPTKTAPRCYQIVNHPVIKGDGSILDGEGPQREAGVYLAYDGTVFPPVPASPGPGDVAAAATLLEDVLLRDFQFRTPLDKVCALSLMLTALVRPFLPTAPGFMLAADQPQVGKTELMKRVIMAATGGPLVVNTMSASEELRKLIAAKLLEGASYIYIDNIPNNSTFESSHIAALLTNEVWSDRVLGYSQTVNARATVLVAMSGNRVTFENDMPSRIVRPHLDPLPSNASAKAGGNMREVKARRGELVTAALTIIRASLLADARGEPRPKTTAPSSRFPEWDKMVRWPLLRAGCEDVGGVFTRNLDLDEETLARAGLLAALAEVFGLDRNFRPSDVAALERGVWTPLVEEIANARWPSAPGAGRPAAMNDLVGDLLTAMDEVAERARPRVDWRAMKNGVGVGRVLAGCAERSDLKGLVLKVTRPGNAVHYRVTDPTGGWTAKVAAAAPGDAAGAATASSSGAAAPEEVQDYLA